MKEIITQGRKKEKDESLMNFKYWIGCFIGSLVANIIFQIIANREIREAVLRVFQLLVNL